MRLLAVLTLFICSATFAAPVAKAKSAPKINKAKIEKLVNEYYVSQAQQKQSAQFSLLPEGYSSANGFKKAGLRPRPGDDCQPGPRPRSNCVDVMCGKMASYECDEITEINEVGAACRGVDGSCVTSICSRLASYECDDISELKQIGAACRSVFDEKCVDVICGKMASYECDDIPEITRVGAACRGRVDADCITSVCGRMASYECDDISELEAVAKTCGGR